MLIGGGSGGHITPLLAVAHELKAIDPNIELVAVCEKNSKFAELYEQDSNISAYFEVSAGKYRRYGGQPFLEKITDVKTLVLNGRDVFRTLKGYNSAKSLLKKQRPDVILVKGGFVAVPMGLAAARLKIPFITHDSDSTPGLANRIISRWASWHATGMPAELYSYPSSKTTFTGIPVSSEFTEVDEAKQDDYKSEIGLGNCKQVITVIGGSQGGEQLNIDVVKISTELMKNFSGLGIVHIAGKTKQLATEEGYKKNLTDQDRQKVVVKGFVNDPAKYTGAADVIISRASATAIAEIALQKKAVIVVPGQLAGAHQDKNAKLLVGKEAALKVAHADATSLLEAVSRLLRDAELSKKLAKNLNKLAKPNAAKELAELTLNIARGN